MGTTCSTREPWSGSRTKRRREVRDIASHPGQVIDEGRPGRRSLAAVLASIPNVGRDEDFVRHQTDTRGCSCRQQGRGSALATHLLRLLSSAQSFSDTASLQRLPLH
jgi:hypothetical protein